MNKIFLVASREFKTRVQKKTFLLSTIGLPLLIFGFYALMIYFQVKTTDNFKVAVSDQSKLFNGKIDDKKSTEVIFSFIDADTAINNRNLKCTIVLSPTQKYDLSFNMELSNATTYSLGSALNFNIKNRNVLKGANLLSANLTGGYEYSYNNNLSPNFLEKFYLLSRNISGNINFILPKFILPFQIKGASKSNQPTTTLTLGSSLQDRINYFKLINTVFSVNYNWHETEKKQWNVVPAFMNFISTLYI